DQDHDEDQQGEHQADGDYNTDFDTALPPWNVSSNEPSPIIAAVVDAPAAAETLTTTPNSLGVADPQDDKPKVHQDATIENLCLGLKSVRSVPV
ncbi:hypothetical protein FRC12_014722, partial [Ceratobasidium sp. 428]